MHEIFVDLNFTATHGLPQLPADHPCHGEHSHDYTVTVYVRGIPDPRTGFVVDYDDVRRAWARVRPRLDGKRLNDVPGLPATTSEALSEWLYHLFGEMVVGVHAVRVREFVDAGCTYYGSGQPRSGRVRAGGLLDCLAHLSAGGTAGEAVSP